MKAAHAPETAPSFPCPGCEATAWKSWRQVGAFPLFRCDRCGLVTWNFTDRDLLAIYRQGYFNSPVESQGYADYLSMEEAIRMNAVRRLRRLAAFLPERLPRPGMPAATPPGAGPRLVELGCAHGFFLDEARKCGYRVWGVEPAEDASEHARARLGLDVATGTLADHELEPGAADAIALWDVIEHVDRPGALLDQCFQLLRPGGVLALSTGNVRSLASRLSGRSWHLYNLPEHLFFFSPPVLRHMLARSGFQRMTVRHPASVYPLKYLEERLRRTAWPRWFWTRFRLPRRLHGLPVAVNLWDVSEVLAERPAAPR
ncbi:MAG: class I SAM-dependent methyltransferase [Kiritimatiellae bacterium]|nr:class I SAM-dependent methyltransferase [Kiritimatiellia bacterium]